MRLIRSWGRKSLIVRGGRRGGGRAGRMGGAIEIGIFGDCIIYLWWGLRNAILVMFTAKGLSALYHMVQDYGR